MSGWKHAGSTTERGYGAAWQKLRERILKRDNYLCQPCLAATPSRVTVARQVDHKKPKAKGGDDSEDNLQAICDPCHLAKSAEDRGHSAPRPKGCDLSGWPTDDGHGWNKGGRP